MSDWKLHDAKNRFSELVDAALIKGPQRVSRRGRAAVVIVAADQFDAMQSAAAKPRRDFVSFLLDGPKVDGLQEAIEEHRKPFRQYDPLQE